MASLTVTKISGVIAILSSDLTYPKYYFGAKGTYQPATDGSTILISIIDSDKVVDQYTVAYGSLTVGTNSGAATIAIALIWLNSIFGT